MHLARFGVPGVVGTHLRQPPVIQRVGVKLQHTSPRRAGVEPSTNGLTSSAPAASQGPGDSPSPQPEEPARSPAPLTASPQEASPEPGTSHPVTFSQEDGGPAGEDFFASQELIDELKSGFGQRGEGWFFAQFAVIALVVFCPFKLQGLMDMFGTLSLTSGLVFLVYSLLSLGRNLSPMPRPRQKHELVTSGMYAYARHPMYGGLLLSTLGLICLSRSETRLALGLLLWWILERKVEIEERWLLDRYSTEYERYKATVKKFVPFIY